MNDLVEQAEQNGGRELAHHAEQPTSALALIYAAATNPEVDAEKMRTLADLHIKMQDREAERRFRLAKRNAIEAMPSIGKRGEILNKQGRVQSRFSRFEDLHREVSPILANHKLSIDWIVGHDGPLITVQPVLSYSDDEMAFKEVGGELALPRDTGGSKSEVQGVVSSVSMGKRHTLKAALNIKEHDEFELGGGSGPELTEQEQVLIDDSRAAAKDGTVKYREWFGALNAQQKGFLVSRQDESGVAYHEQNKAAAAQFDN
jgi:hypothetical protein